VIDWVTARVPIRSAVGLNTGVVISVNAHGEEEWSSPKRTNVRGSHAATVAVKTFNNGEVEFAGSPAKFLQGHNIFGSDDLVGLGAAMIEGACKSVGLELLKAELDDIRAGRYELKRVDVNYSFATGSRTNALAWIEKAAAVGTLQNRGKGRLRNSSTVTWGEASRHWKLKAYSKGQEITARDHGLPEAIPMRSQLAAWSDDKLRLEVEIHARQLQKLGLEQASSWRNETPWKLFREYVAKLRLGGRLILSVNAVQSLPYRLRPTYTNWARGEDLRQLMSKPTYYRHCRELLALGINIAAPPTKDEVPTISLSHYLESPCAKVPTWAMGTDLFCEPENDDEGLVDGQGSITVRRESSVTRTEQTPAGSRSKEFTHAYARHHEPLEQLSPRSPGRAEEFDDQTELESAASNS
jgi:II/X family phage/plasmid replication protein